MTCVGGRRWPIRGQSRWRKVRALNRLNRLFKEELEGVFVRCMFFGLLGIWNMEYMGGGVGGGLYIGCV